MNRSKYIEYNTLCREVVKDLKTDYNKQFSHNGSRVVRTKFWDVNGNIRRSVKALKKLPFVAEVKYVSAQLHSPYHYSSPNYIKVIYKY